MSALGGKEDISRGLIAMSAYDPKRIVTGLNDFGLNSHPALTVC
jgi:hypothetical protein